MSTPMGRVNRAERLLDELIQNHVIRASSRDALIILADPFHDKVLSNLRGFPDGSVGKSVVSRVKRTITVTKPGALPAGNWDCMVTMYPWTIGDDVSPLLTSYDVLGNTFKANGLGSQQNHALCVYADVPGSSLGPHFSNVNITGTSVPDTFTEGVNRVIACGFEVYNTTAEIYKQGSCTVSRQLNPGYCPHTTQYFGDNGANFTHYGSSDTQKIRAPPKNTEEASLLRGTRTFKAEQGCYCVPTLIGGRNPARLPDLVQPVILSEDEKTGDAVRQTPIIGHARNGFRTLGSGVFSNIIYPITSWNWTNFNSSTAHFTGLSEQTTLTVVGMWYIERFPTPTEAAILTSARPTAEYDPNALLLYNLMLESMPAGVPVAENAFGDWFAGVVNQLTRYITPVARAFGGPVGNTVANVSQALNEATREQRELEHSNAELERVKRRRKKLQAQLLAAEAAGPGMKSKRQGKKALPPPKKGPPGKKR